MMLNEPFCVPKYPLVFSAKEHSARSILPIDNKFMKPLSDALNHT